jgi:hypothetical protein
VIDGCGHDDARFGKLGNEGIGQHGRYAKWAQNLLGKVAGVERHDHIGNTGQGSGQDVPIVGIGQSQALLPALITVNPTPKDMLVHEPTGSE